MGESRHLAVVAGNGLSIAFNPKLHLGRITEQLLTELHDLPNGGSAAVQAVRDIARRVEGDDEPDVGDFEKLVGAFESQAATLAELEGLVDILDEGNDQLRNQLRAVIEFTSSVRDLGLGIVLRTIMRESRGGWDVTAPLHSFFEAMIRDFDGRVWFGNLNYDTLAMASLKQINAPVCDMANGIKGRPIKIYDHADDGKAVEIGECTGYALRTELDFPDGPRWRVRLLHLHGSLTFWGNEEEEKFVKLPIETLREYDMFAALQDRRIKVRPAVVLANANEKPARVKAEPFALGYKTLGHGLGESKHWLIIGYSFRDESVNSMLRQKFVPLIGKPKVLVCTFGDELTRDEIELALGWGGEDRDSRDWLIIDREGVRGMTERDSWATFVQ